MDKSALFIVGFFLIGGAGFVWQQFQPEPAINPHSVSPANLDGLTVGDPIVDVTIPAQFSANAQIGKQVFEAACSACHGTNAAGQNGIAPPLVHITYEPGHHGDGAFLSAARNGVISHHWEFGNMPAVEGLTDGDVKLIVAYIREMQRANGIF
ncbi:c-type cytochrome [Yoonia sp.]|uniref:c-type cytochrome n=1 Tax=Yoonia sp. TaxID=2212373 RepID=UPI0023B4B2F3